MLDLIVKRNAIPYSPVDYCVLAAATAVAWVFVVELDLTILLTFRRRGGLYFWSLLISSWGCVLHGLGFILSFLVGSPWTVTLPFIEIGWVTMVTGQAFVLFSRLHLVVRSDKILRYLLWLIIVDACAFHIPTIVFTVGKNSPHPDPWKPKFDVMERIQLVGFCLQEFLISLVHRLYRAHSRLRLSQYDSQGHAATDPDQSTLYWHGHCANCPGVHQQICGRGKHQAHDLRNQTQTRIHRPQPADGPQQSWLY